jgi:hypothetical protein
MSRFAEERARILKAAGGDIRRHLPAIKADGSVDFEHGDLRTLLRATARAYDLVAEVANRLAALERETKNDRALRGGGAVDAESRRVLRQARFCGEDSLNDLDRWRLEQAREDVGGGR